MAPITDATNKIISKQRTQITDTRKKLVHIAKLILKLDKLHQERGRLPGPVRNTFPNRGIFSRASPIIDRLFTDSSKQVVSQPLNKSRIGSKRQINTHTFAEVRSSEKSRLFEFEHKPKPKPLLQTVENDLEVIDDPMEDKYIPEKLASLNRVANLLLKIITHNNDIHEDSVATIHRTIGADKEKSPPKPTSILKKLPMATLRSDEIAQKTEKSRSEYRIIVSNLRNTVTGTDVEELFEDVGIMLESRLVRPGIAEVIYQTQEDAQKAIDLYHNRHLDGQPINCLLVTRQSPTTARSSNKPVLYSTHANVEPDISIFHKVLFRNL